MTARAMAAYRDIYEARRCFRYSAVSTSNVRWNVIEATVVECFPKELASLACRLSL